MSFYPKIDDLHCSSVTNNVLRKRSNGNVTFCRHFFLLILIVSERLYKRTISKHISTCMWEQLNQSSVNVNIYAAIQKECTSHKRNVWKNQLFLCNIVEVHLNSVVISWHVLQFYQQHWHTDRQQVSWRCPPISCLSYLCSVFRT